MNKTNVRFCDIAFGTEFYFCDPATVGDGVNLCRFKKTGVNLHKSNDPVRLINMGTDRDVPIRPISNLWNFPVWPQEPTPVPAPAPKEADQLATNLVGRWVAYHCRPCIVNSVFVKDGTLYAALSPAKAIGPIIVTPVTAISI